METAAKRLFSQNVTVTRTTDPVDGRGFVTYVAVAPWGRTEARSAKGRWFAEFYDLSGKRHEMRDSGAEITFKALDEAWQTQPATELPTTEPAQDYADFNYLAVDGGKLVAIKDSDTPWTEGSKVEVTSYEQFLHIAAANDQQVLFSSSVDFPEEGTDNPAVIALCKQIRG